MESVCAPRNCSIICMCDALENSKFIHANYIFALNLVWRDPMLYIEKCELKAWSYSMWFIARSLTASFVAFPFWLISFIYFHFTIGVSDRCHKVLQGNITVYVLFCTFTRRGGKKVGKSDAKQINFPTGSRVPGKSHEHLLNLSCGLR